LKRGDIPSIGGLTSFVAAAQHGSFTRAGSQLNLTQGAVSRQIHELESRLGIRLFERIRQRVILTDAGKLYLSHVKKALDDLSLATQKVVSCSNNTILNLAVLPTFAARWLIPRLPPFQNGNPRIMIHITTRQTPADFVAEPFDAAVFNDPANWPGTLSHYLMDADIVAVCSPKLDATRTIRTAADITKFPLLHKMGKPNSWTEWMEKSGVTMDAPLQGHAYQSFAMLSQAAVAGSGIALLPRYLVDEEIDDGRLEVVASEFAALKTSYYLILPEARASSRAVQTFAKWLIAETAAWNSRALCRARKKSGSRR